MTRRITPLYHTDMSHLARLLLGVDRSERMGLAHEIFANAERGAQNAGRDVKINNTCGYGSISQACQQHKLKLMPEPDFSCEDYRACWFVALEAASWHAPVRRMAAE